MGRRLAAWDSHSWLLKIRKLYSGCKAHDVFHSCACVLSHFSRVQLFPTLWTAVCQAPLSMGFSRQEYWGGFPCPPPGDLHDPGIKPASLTSPASAGELPLVPPAKSVCVYTYIYTYSPPGSSVQGILQARTPGWVAMPFSNIYNQITLLYTCN